jgi:hypothetical protein
MSVGAYDIYPCVCAFPGCTRPAPPVDQGDLTLCADHERLRFYSPDEFLRGFEQTVREH